MTAIERVAAGSAAAIGRAIAAGEVDPVALTEHLLERIGASAEPVFITVTAARARAEAEAARARQVAGRPLSALDGVAVAWKDLVDIATSPTTAGSSLYRDSPPKEADAPCAANLAAAGMVTLGKVNLTEFAYSGLGLNPHFGTPANPHDPTTRRAPGGSSSGSAVAVAAGLAPVAIGTDTGGSVRIPAAFNGLVGYKSSGGRIDKRGVFPLSDTLDSIGPIGRTVEDCILVEMLLRGAATGAVRRAPLAGQRFVLATNVVLDEIEADVATALEAAVDDLAKSGAQIESRPVPVLDEVMRVTAERGTLTAAEAYTVHKALVEGPEVERIDRRVVSRILNGKRMSAADVLIIQRERRRLMAELAADLDGAVLVMPTTVHVAPPIAPLEADVALFHSTNLRTLRNTMLGNFLDLCGLAIPSGITPSGMPASILFSLPAGEDDRLLSLGLELDRVLLPRRL
jgi:aspartyl-tRNA(Asn)/glutamyl-tRNA(Gln) amidotransferase subunit A